ncbi:MAG: transglycosylase SLT domain-containing protein [Deltaproteobacteria bacterium]|nr:transglycosylase SLT domain-containing protein [Deltaproteobacteria bacterium]
MIQILIVLTVLCAGTCSYAQPTDVPDMECIPSLVSSIRVKPPLDFCGEPAPIDSMDARERLERELLLMLWDRDQTIMWLKRANRFMPYIQAVLKDQRLPDDLKYIPVVESSLRALAGSPKGAMGYWQFIKDTGERYGLTITEELDERRNIAASTRSAVAYLKKLHADFGSWTLAAAAYNMGEAGLKNEILLQDTSDFYDLYLYQETQRYVFRILAAKLILSDPGKYGFKLIPEDLYPPDESDRVQLELAQKTPVLSIARAARTSFKVIRDLNPEIRGYYLPKGALTLSIPRGASAGFQERLAGQIPSLASARSETVYVVKKGDSLSGIAERLNIPVQTLLIWNHLGLNQPIRPGDRLSLNPGSDKKLSQESSP